MRDGVSTGEKDTADLDALAADNLLIRHVRWQLVAWSGITTLLVLVVLGAALDLIAARTLEDRGNQGLMARADAFRELPDPRGSGFGFSFGAKRASVGLRYRRPAATSRTA